MEPKRNPDGVLNQLPPAKLHLLIGEITALMMVSPVHRQFQVRDLADIILPAINLNQFRIYRNDKNEPVALVTWGYFSKEVEQQYIGGKAVLSEAELASGDIIYLTDFIAPYGHIKQVVKDLKLNVFPNDIGHSIRFDEQGKPRKKIRTFRGVNYGKKPH